MLGPVLYTLYTTDLPIRRDVIVATYADDSTILAAHQDPEIASRILQTQLSDIRTWLDKWRIKESETKSVHITFTTRKRNCRTVNLYGRPLPSVNEVKYLVMYLDRRLTWTKHIKTKRKAMGLKLFKMYWLVGRKSQLHSSLHSARVSVVAYAKWRLSFNVSECKQSGPYKLLSTVRLTAAGKRITHCLFDEWKRVRKICPLARTHVQR